MDGDEGWIILDQDSREPTRQQMDLIERLAAKHDRVEVYPIMGQLDIDIDCRDAHPKGGRGSLTLSCRYRVTPEGRTIPPPPRGGT